MPISKSQALEIVRRLARGFPVGALATRLKPCTPEVRPLPPPVPGSREHSAEARDARVAFLESQGVPVPHLSGREAQPDPATLQGNIENFVGWTQVPTGLAGPLRVNGLHAHGDFYVPLATSEGALVASYQRGIASLTRRPGASRR